MKKKFECGHRGKGQYCHRCKQADSLANRVRNLSPAHQKDVMARAEQLRHGGRHESVALTPGVLHHAVAARRLALETLE